MRLVNLLLYLTICSMEKDNFNIAFGTFVKNKRLEKGLTQDQLSDKLGNNAQNISRLERGEIAPTLFWCYNLANALEIELPKLLESFNFENKY